MPNRSLNGLSHGPHALPAANGVGRVGRDPYAAPEGIEAAQRRITLLERRERKLKVEVMRLLRAVEQAHRFAYHDELTGLPNRRMLSDRIGQAVARAQRQHGQVALLFLDLDGFKNINDTLGHAAGDTLLQQVAARLSACVRTNDTVSRYGGDEFAILLPELDSRASAVTAAAKICAQLGIPFVVDDCEITLTASIGMAVYPSDGSDFRDLMKRSDQAMYREKHRSVSQPAINVRERTDREIGER